MDIKDLVLSTIDEIERSQKGEKGGYEEQRAANPQREQPYATTQIREEAFPEDGIEEGQDNLVELTPEHKKEKREKHEELVRDDELRFLTSLRERILVLFEGFQSPNNRELERKIDLVLNFLEYQLSVIDERIEKRVKGEI